MLIRTVIILAAALFSTAAIADDYPIAECIVSDDASSILVTASNGGGTSYQCTATCKASVTGQRAFSPITCNFNLAKNTDTRVVCSFDGGSPKFYSDISRTRATCVPR
ncbi:MAG: hypothetical protein ACO1OG_02430 [Devosia sp.]